MNQNIRRWILIGGAAALVLLPLLFYAYDSIRGSGEVTRNVSAAGVELGGLGEEDALAAMRDYEAALATTPSFFTVNGVEFELDPRRIDLDIDEQAIVDDAMAQRRDRGFFAGFFGWFGTFGDQIELEVQVTIDNDQLDVILDQWEQAAIDLPAYEGGVIISDARALPDYPRPGEGIDTDTAHADVLANVETLDRSVVALETSQIEPTLTDDDIDEATAVASSLIDAPVTLSSDDPEFSVTFTREQLADALMTDVLNQVRPEIVFEFDEQQILTILAPMRPDIEQPARDAEIVIDTGARTVKVLPSRTGTVLDAGLVGEALLKFAPLPSNGGPFPFGVGAQPAFSSDDAEALGDLEYVSGFTTSHPAGQPRVTNIHLMADTVDGAIVYPGREFSLNEHVGQRTATKGYVPAPMIFNGELVDDVGGGVSQFATTFFNAVFYGCYEDVDHKPHSYYFSRYPEVNEATISWPSPNLVFRNNTDAAVIIKTVYTATDITVQFYGDNGGCEAERQLGSRYAFTDPPVEYEANRGIPPNDQRVTQSGWGGFSNSVTRVMTWPDGTVEEEEFVWAYSPAPKIIEVHPCMMPGAEDVACPVQVPGLLGWSVSDARGAVEAAGLTLVEGGTVEVPDEGQNGLIVEQTPLSGDWVDAGTSVTVITAVYVPPPPPPPDEDGGEGGEGEEGEEG